MAKPRQALGLRKPIVIKPQNVAYPMEISEISEWFDWMRSDIAEGGIRLPDEETSTLFALKALHLSARLRGTYRHLPANLAITLVKSAIIYQCWELEKNSRRHNTRWPRQHRTQPLPLIEATRYLCSGENDEHHIVEASDGSRYMITVPAVHGFLVNSTAATEFLYNQLARMMGFAVQDVAAVSFGAKVLKEMRDGNPGMKVGRRNAPYCGFKQVSGALLEESPPHTFAQRGGDPFRQCVIGAFVLDIWTLNLAPRQWTPALNARNGCFQATLVGNHKCFSGSDWSVFLESGLESLPAMQTAAVAVRKLREIDIWRRRAFNLDLNPLWEAAFGMPADWYGSNRPLLSSVLDKLASRKWDLLNAIRRYAKFGYTFEPEPDVVPEAPDDWLLEVERRHLGKREEPVAQLEAIHHSKLREGVKGSVSHLLTGENGV